MECESGWGEVAGEGKGEGIGCESKSGGRMRCIEGEFVEGWRKCCGVQLDGAEEIRGQCGMLSEIRVWL